MKLNALLMEAAKDDKRINDMVTKSKGDDAKLLKLAQNMAKSIKGGQKATDRTEAAIKILGEKHPVTDTFKKRAEELGMSFGGKNVADDASYSKGYIFLPTVSAMALWQEEILGQLSDGAWENSKPYDHYKYWFKLGLKKGNPEVKGGGWASRVGYNLKTLVTYGLGQRMINMGRMAKALGKIPKYNTWAVEGLPEEWDGKKISGFNGADLKKYYATSYDKSDLNNDLAYIKKAMKSARH